MTDQLTEEDLDSIAQLATGLSLDHKGCATLLDRLISEVRRQRSLFREKTALYETMFKHMKTQNDALASMDGRSVKITENQEEQIAGLKKVCELKDLEAQALRNAIEHGMKATEAALKIVDIDVALMNNAKAILRACADSPCSCLTPSCLGECPAAQAEAFLKASPK